MTGKHKKDWDPGGRPGKLHGELGIPEDERISQERLREAEHSPNREIRDDAIRAETMERWAKPKHKEEKHKSFIDLEPIFGPSSKP